MLRCSASISSESDKPSDMKYVCVYITVSIEFVYYLIVMQTYYCTVSVALNKLVVPQSYHRTLFCVLFSSYIWATSHGRTLKPFDLSMKCCSVKDVSLSYTKLRELCMPGDGTTTSIIL